jgi:hypothetical protein
MADTPDLSKFVPGFDFLQGLVRNAGSAMPGVGQWIAPTLDPEEIDKRIQELRTVQFWLEQNARMLAATIQALEVQRMTLSTLRNMNVQMGDLQESMRIRMPGSSPAPSPAPATARASAPAAASAAPSPAADGTSQSSASGAAGAGMVDPMQWWGALTKEFSALATHALKDGAAEVTRNLPGAAAMAEAAGAVGQAMKTAMKPPAAKKTPPARKAASAKTARKVPAKRKPA